MTYTSNTHTYKTAAARRWAKRRDQTTEWLPNWRTPKRQRLLLTLYLLCIVGFFVASALSVVNAKAFFAWIALSVLSSLLWTALRITIDVRDSAPDEVLDEYEADVLDFWRRRANNGLYISLYATALLLIAIGLSMGEPPTTTLLGLTAANWMYTLGMFAASAVMLFISLPTVGYIWTFHVSAMDSVHSEEASG